MRDVPGMKQRKHGILEAVGQWELTSVNCGTSVLKFQHVISK
jgi:hypothetical protein